MAAEGRFPCRCTGCGGRIVERTVCSVLGRPWHSTCLRCVACHRPLLDRCLTRDGVSLYCRDDFYRQYGPRCGSRDGDGGEVTSGCGRLVVPGDLIQQAWDVVYHDDCLRCVVCRSRPQTGDRMYALHDGISLACRRDFIRIAGLQAMIRKQTGYDDVRRDVDDADAEHCDVTTEPCDDVIGMTATTARTCDCEDLRRAESCSSRRRGPRTTIKMRQLEALRSTFDLTPKPPRHVREQLARQTGLSMRVIQVWFQNRRSKERRLRQVNSVSLSTVNCCCDNVCPWQYISMFSRHRAHLQM